MKVLVFTSLFPNHEQPNLGIFIQQRMLHFSRLKDCEIRVVAPIPYCPDWPFLKHWRHFSRISRRETLEGVEVYHPRYPLLPRISMPFHGLLMFLGCLLTVKRIRREFPFALLDAHFVYPDGLAGVLLAKLFSVPVVVSARGSDIHQFMHFKSIRPQLCYTLKQADRIISVSQRLRQDILSLGIKPEKIEVIPNGVDTGLFFPVPRETARRQLGLDQKQRLILAVGNLIPLKGFQLIIAALPELLRHEPEVMLCIIGRGPYREELRHKAEELQVAGKVRFAGEKGHADLNLWYNSADIFCHASFREGWANVIMEALACKVPIVATEESGAGEIIGPAGAAILVERTPEALARGLKLGLAAGRKQDEIREQVPIRDWHLTAQEVEAVFASLLKQQG